MKAKRRVFYESPTSLAVEVKMNGIICGSQDGIESRSVYNPDDTNPFNE